MLQVGINFLEKFLCESDDGWSGTDDRRLMTDVHTASTMTSEDHDNKLLQLAIYLNGLPDSLPIKDPADSHYNFQIFELEAE